MRALLAIGAGLLGAVLVNNAIKRQQKNNAHLIRSKRGDAPDAPTYVETFKISSSAFEPGQLIPAVYSCEAQDKSPPLQIAGAPENTRSLALVMEDPDSPIPPIFDHWLVWNIPPSTTNILEGQLPNGAVQGKNTLKNSHYNGPCTPNGTHRYRFKLFALNTPIDLPAGSTKRQLKAAMKGHILAQSELIGLYTANRTTQGNLMVEMVKTASKV